MYVQMIATRESSFALRANERFQPSMLAVMSCQLI